MDKAKPKRKIKVKTLNIDINEPICNCPEPKYQWGFGETRIYVRCQNCGVKSYSNILSAKINPTFTKTKASNKNNTEVIREKLLGDWWQKEQKQTKAIITIQTINNVEDYCSCSNPFSDDDKCFTCGKTLSIMKEQKND